MKIIEIFNDIPQELQSVKSIAIDTETMGLNLSRDRLCLIQMNFGDDKCYLMKSDDFSKASNLKSVLENKDIQKIFHFARFDVAMLKKHLKTDVNNIYCTKIASKIARTYSPKHSLKDLVRELAGIELNKEEQSSYWGKDSISETQKTYAANDVLYLHDLRNKLNEILIRENRMQLALRCFEVINLITDMDLMNFDFEYTFSH